MTEWIEGIKRGDLEGLKALLEAQPDLIAQGPVDGTPLLLLAAYHRQPTVATWLADQGAPVGLYEAAALGQTDRVLELLRDPSADINAFNADGYQMLGLAAFFGHLALTTALLERGASVSTASSNAQRVTPLHSAVAGKYLEIARVLIAHGADVNAVQQGGFTPLHAAAQHGHVQMIDVLLKAGADRHAKTDAGMTALDFVRADTRPLGEPAG